MKIRSSLGFCGTRRVHTCDRGWGGGKAFPTPFVTGVVILEGKIKKTTFQAVKSCFWNLQFPIAIALWAAGKAPEKLTACSQGCLEGKIKKTTFQAVKSCFLNFAVSHCNCALGSWKSTWKAHCLLSGCVEGKIKEIFSWKALWAAGKAPEKLTACSQGCLEGKIKKQLFRLWKVVFWNLQLEGSPIAIALWAAGKAPAICVLGFVLQANLSFFSIDR